MYDDEVIVLIEGDARVTVAPAVGGAIAGFVLRDRPILRPTDAAALAQGDVRAFSCYPLVPYSNRIRDAVLHFAGRAWQLARNFGSHPHSIHGLGWQRPWRVARRDESSLQLVLEHDAGDDRARSAWPWPFMATQTFGLATTGTQATALVVEMTITSRADTPFPFGLGWHPYFPRNAATRLHFATGSVWCNDATQLPVERCAIPAKWCFEPARPVDDIVLDQVFNGWNGRAEVIQPTTGMKATVGADSTCDRLVVYAPAQRDFVAVEPVSHETDAFNRAARGAPDTGTRILAPGASFGCTMRVTVEPLD